MDFKFLLSLISPLMYLFLRNHNEVYQLDQTKYHKKFHFSIFNFDIGFLFLIGLFYLSISRILWMDLWVIYYVFLSLFYLKKNKRKHPIKEKERYYARIWRLDLIYLLFFSYFIFLYREESQGQYYFYLGMSIYFQTLFIQWINQMMLKIEDYKNGSGKK